jgi:hypothetical protein
MVLEILEVLHIFVMELFILQPDAPKIEVGSRDFGCFTHIFNGTLHIATCVCAKNRGSSFRGGLFQLFVIFVD